MITWAIANFAIAGLVSWLTGGWYIGWPVSPTIGMLVELGLIIAPNLILPILVLRYWRPEPVGNISDALGWQWHGWCSLAAGTLAFAAYYVLVKVIVRLVGGSIPYNLPGATGEPIVINNPLDILKWRLEPGVYRVMVGSSSTDAALLETSIEITAS